MVVIIRMYLSFRSRLLLPIATSMVLVVPCSGTWVNLSLLSPHGRPSPARRFNLPSTFPRLPGALSLPHFRYQRNSSYQLHQSSLTLRYSRTDRPRSRPLSSYHLFPHLSLPYSSTITSNIFTFFILWPPPNPIIHSISPTETQNKPKSANANVNVNVTPRRENADRDDTPLRTKYLLYLIIT